jgi:hypothetical protein
LKSKGDIFMKRTLLVLTVGVLLTLGLIGVVEAADNASHNVTVTVTAISEIAITGGNITLTISTAAAGSNPPYAVNGACGLNWTTNEDDQKITVEADAVSLLHTLKVIATGASIGTPSAERTITVAPQDIVTGIGKSIGGCTLNYTAIATAAQGVSSVVHAITYTITDES